MAKPTHIELAPPLVESGHFDDLLKIGQTLSTLPSPMDNSMVVFLTNLKAPQADDCSREEIQPLYFAASDALPSSERRLFITDTLIIFAALQNLKKTAKHESGWNQVDENLRMIRKLAIDYVNFIKECWVHASQPISHPENPLQLSSEHYRILYTCFSLFVVLFLPEPGYEQGPVGDDLMEWLNTHFIEPSTEEGDQLSALDQPWQDESFWPYLTRTILRGLSKASLFFLKVLEQHPSDGLKNTISMLAPLVDTQPRLQNFLAEREFAYASRRWSDKVKTLRIEMDRVPEEERYDDFENWWDRVSDIVGILEGRSEVVIRVCEELGADWKEVCVAWCIFIDPRLRRQDLPDIVSQIMDDMPADPTSPEDMVHCSLFANQSVQTLQHSSQIDTWLSAHLADILDLLSMIEVDCDEESDMSIRDYHILSYANYLHSDPALWRITIDYMYSCADVGKAQGDEVLLRVPLRLQEPYSQSQASDKFREGDIIGTLKDVNQACFDYQREAIRRTVCKIAAQSLVGSKDYALALSYCTSAEDWPGLGRIVDRVLDEYITNGPLKFSEYASAIAPSIQDIRNQSTSQGVYMHRLMFAVRYANFHDLLRRQEYQDAATDLVTIFHEDLAPKSWWSIMLTDCIPLLRYGPKLLFTFAGASLLLHKVEEIAVQTSQGCQDDYLSVYIRILKGGQKDALERLKLVRLALARYLARCFILGTDNSV